MLDIFRNLLPRLGEAEVEVGDDRHDEEDHQADRRREAIICSPSTAEREFVGIRDQDVTVSGIV